MVLLQAIPAEKNLLLTLQVLPSTTTGMQAMHVVIAGKACIFMDAAMASNSSKQALLPNFKKLG